MRYLREGHGYISLKMEFQHMQYPALGAQCEPGNGFGHMVENEVTEHEPEENVASNKYISDQCIEATVSGG